MTTDDTHSVHPGLPDPSEQEWRHSQRLGDRIRAEIAEDHGSIPFARFMDLALHAPGLGYYAAGARKFGPGGDFVTAPELGSLFARCLARQCAQILAQIGGDILEFGAGSGVLAGDLLAELEQLDALPQRYLILETSAELCARQRQRLAATLPHLDERIHWLHELPADFRGVILANEVLDAMPVEIFHVTQAGIQQCNVEWNGSAFAWKDSPAPTELAHRVEGLALQPDYRSEINFAAEAWIHSVGSILDRGVALVIDYGFPQHEYYHPQRNEGTLLCHYRHRTLDDPLTRVGLQDITAHIDFTAMAQAALDAGLEILGYTSQAAFLLGSGLDELLTQSNPSDARAHLTLTTEAKKLTMPSEMGELFKVLAVGRGVDVPLRGFALDDRRGRL